MTQHQLSTPLAPNILVLGGTGFVGSALCEQLSAQWIAAPSAGAKPQIIVPTRRIARGAHVQVLPHVTLVEANLHDDGTLHALVSQADAVVNLVAQLHGSEKDFERAHVALPARLAQACVRQGVQRVIHVSALGVPDTPAGAGEKTTVDAPSRYLRSKARGERALRSTPGLGVTILRPSIIFGEHDGSTSMFARMQQRFPVIPLAHADAQLQPVWVDDVTRAITRCLMMPSTIGQVFECTGPDVMSLGQLVRQSGEQAGRARPILPLPHAVGRLQALLMEWIPGEPVLTRDNLDSLSVPSLATGQHPGLVTLGVAPSSFSQVRPRALNTTHALNEARRAVARR